jgi:hypothetical protein
MYNKHTRHNTNQGNTMMKKTNRSPYEIRADLLVLAKEILIEQAHANANRNDEGVILSYKAPTTADIVEQAKTLNQFVSLDDKS